MTGTEQRGAPNPDICECARSSQVVDPSDPGDRRPRRDGDGGDFIRVVNLEFAPVSPVRCGGRNASHRPRGGRDENVLIGTRCCHEGNIPRIVDRNRRLDRIADPILTGLGHNVEIVENAQADPLLQVIEGRPQLRPDARTTGFPPGLRRVADPEVLGRGPIPKARHRDVSSI